jgi:hypothetical protein
MYINVKEYKLFSGVRRDDLVMRRCVLSVYNVYIQARSMHVCWIMNEE